jgi:hypothetical protein
MLLEEGRRLRRMFWLRSVKASVRLRSVKFECYGALEKTAMTDTLRQRQTCAE